MPVNQIVQAFSEYLHKMYTEHHQVDFDRYTVSSALQSLADP